MSHSRDYLWGHIFRCPTEGISLVVTLKNALLGESEICNLEVALVVQDYIFWLQISLILVKRDISYL
jgi:hypothetical protein